MRDFNDFKSESGNGSGNVFEFMKNVAGRFDGKNTTELYRAVIDEAKKRKAAGKLTDAEIDSFAAALSPFLDDEKRKALRKIVEKLKKI